MVQFSKAALAVAATLMMSGSAFAEQRILKYNTDFDPTPPAEMAKAGMEGFQEFMAKPENLDAILERLEKTRLQVYK